VRKARQKTKVKRQKSKRRMRELYSKVPLLGGARGGFKFGLTCNPELETLIAKHSINL
jgi:hypothetical protein